MSTQEIIPPQTEPEQSLAQVPEPIDAIQLPDGSVQPAWPLALKGLEESLQAGKIDEKRLAQMYKGWDPEFPESSIYQHIHNR